jgi:hypothetical protein
MTAQVPGEVGGAVVAAVIQHHHLVGELLTPAEDTNEVLVCFIADQECRD